MASATPCPFLEDGRCSICEVRPIACRAHHVLDDDETSCELYRGVNITHSYNNHTWEQAGAVLLSRTGLHDIRDWFPKGRR